MKILGKIKTIIDMAAIIIFMVVIFFYRDNPVAYKIECICILYILIKKVANIVKNPLPKGIYYIKRISVLRICIGIVALLYFSIVIKSFIENDVSEFVLTSIMNVPLMIYLFLDQTYYRYFYKDGLVIDRNIYEFRKMKSFNWKKQDICYMEIEYEDNEIQMYVPWKKRVEVESILKDNIGGIVNDREN
ncbi:hypothetical protein [Anaeromicrobium sediminis]|uniref:DUF5673 domain-containing protein n=1 Tax=Anaeromicrobium sediminis TaxID=1478221 RepID=A0A267MIM5_9FIRM|nr:hypothetical protein [Anaeromicrobium sediminis]PAB59262.1 hypothetical protein CCE28_10370 [Anaeromicrobium sediminis]